MEGHSNKGQPWSHGWEVSAHQARPRCSTLSAAQNSSSKFCYAKDMNDLYFFKLFCLCHVYFNTMSDNVVRLLLEEELILLHILHILQVVESGC